MAQNALKIKIIDSLTAMASMSKEWNDLLQNSNANSVFLTWEWLFTWAETFLDEKRQLFILALYEDNELVGVAPWCIHRIYIGGLPQRRIEFLGTPETGADYLDVVSRHRREKSVVQAVYGFLFKDARDLWETVMLQEIPSDSLILQHFLDQLEKDGKYVELMAGAFCPAIALPPDRELFLKTLSPHRRNHYARDTRLIQKQGTVSHRRIMSGDGLAALEEFHALYDQYWHKTDKERSFIEKLVARHFDSGMLEIDLLSVNGKNCAATVQLKYKNIVHGYHIVADRSFSSKFSVGNYLVGQCIERAIDERFSAYDFLKGSEDYKFHWTNSGRRLVHVIFHNRRVIPALVLIQQGVRAAAKIMLR